MKTAASIIFYKNVVLAFVLVAMSLSNKEAKSQCPCDNTILLTWAAPTIVGQSVSTSCIYGGGFCRVTGMVANNVYRVYTCGNTAFDTQITIYPFASCVPAGYSDDDCGPSQSEIYFQPAAGGTYDILVDEYNCISNATCMDLTVELTCIASTAPASIIANPNPVCEFDTVQLTVSGGSLGTGAQWEWYSGTCGIGPYEGTGASITVSSPFPFSNFFVRAEGNCDTTSCANVLIIENPLPSPNIGPDDTICIGDSAQLTATGPVSCSWSPVTGLSNPNSCNPLASPPSTTTYTVTVTDGNGCTNDDFVTITVNTSSTAPTSIDVSQNPICSGQTIQLTEQGGTLGTGAQWEWYTGSCGGTWFDSGINAVVTPATTTTYYVRAEGACDTTSCASVTITVNPIYAITDPAIAVCNGDSVLIYGTYQSSAGMYYDSLTTVNGCDSVFSTVLTVDPVYAVNDSISIVQGDSAFVGGGWQTAPGIYYDTLTAMNGCDSIVATTLTVVIGINQSSINKHQFSIFPNPNNGEFTIEMELTKPLEMEMELLNVIGQAVYSEKLGKVSGSYSKQLDLNYLAKGIYTLKLTSEEGTTTRKLMIE